MAFADHVILVRDAASKGRSAHQNDMDSHCYVDETQSPRSG
jgi:hypothetical protein